MSDIEMKYKKCLLDAEKRFKNGKLKLCPRGYCTAKNIFEVYPSAYANGYATSVCQGKKPDALDVVKANDNYMKKINKLKQTKKKDSLQRWYKEQWVNLCEKDPSGPGGFAICGTGKGVKNPKKYPYCRAYYRLPGTEVVTAQELQKYYPDYIEKMCSEKRSLEQGIDGKPTYIRLPKNIINDIKSKRGGGILNIKIPSKVRKEAKLGLQLLQNGFKGGTQTGWLRAQQLAFDDTIDINSLAEMRTWFARHGPDAIHGGTSYPGYCKWIVDGKPMNSGFQKYRGAVSWLIWGGNEAYLWLKSPRIQYILAESFPSKKKANTVNNLNKEC